MMPPADWIVPDWPAPTRVHAFVTTRAGGVSTGPYATFNLGDLTADDPAAVRANKARLQTLLPGHVAAFLAATVVCAVANALARATDRPAQLYHLPGMMLLVPGSLGFAGFQGFLRGDWALGAAKLSSTVLVAAGLVMGVLLANVLVSPKKLL